MTSPVSTDGSASKYGPRDLEFWDAADPREARERIAEALRIEVLGPERADEELVESPLNRYVMGMLAPFGTEIPEEEIGDELVADSDGELSGSPDPLPPVSQALSPSSIGLSFLVGSGTRELSVFPSWGDYDAQEIDEDVANSAERETEAVEAAEVATETEMAEQQAERKQRRRVRRKWIRAAREPASVTIRLSPGKGLLREEIPAHAGITVEHVSREIGDRIAVSVFLVNRRTAPQNARPAADRWIFQPALAVRSPALDPVFLPRALEPGLAATDRDRDSNRLLFRRRQEFAVGHGCAAMWSDPSDSDVSDEVRTDSLPQHELPKIDALPIPGSGLEMSALAAVRSPVELKALLDPLALGYEQWIARTRETIGSLPSDLQAVARLHMDDCLTVVARIRSGIDLLVDDSAAFSAFRFANQAMLLQRSHTVWARERKRSPKDAPPKAILGGTWHPFQVAFILLNLEGLVHIESDERSIGDLLWFPTGGGKTEAYLGLTAFTLALRRLRTIAGMRTDAGVSVLMRYTMRLLTVQQFQRAATLLCACEVLRQKDQRRWGAYRFSIGLWLGSDGTPNAHDESRRILIKLQNDVYDEDSTPCVLESCPWCGESLRPRDYWTDGEAVRTRVACPRPDCAFSRAHTPAGLPVLVVDEEIYLECPSLVIATVDKFAQMPWRGEIQSLFGHVSRECGKCGFLSAATDHPGTHGRLTPNGVGAVSSTERLAPPDLIIQDELHLISGPLGTLVGLYETAVDYLAGRPVGNRLVGPKVVASTATVRRAFEQVHALFNRQLRVFPPPGLEPGDSFFAVERAPGPDAPGRLYLGICAPGKSMATAYVRVAAVLLAAASGLRRNPAFAEPYLTLISYFNSLRELGGALRLMDDDIPARLDQLRNAGLPWHQRPVYAELTSRIRQEAIPQLLRRLEQRHDAPRGETDPLPLDAVLASNMISVGVDIDRLGVMTVRGQPKTTAEYIQATSRVGRQAWGPGLVVTIYNWSRPRDLSHYERFRHYHGTLYRNVEAVSATPFSSRALDRGIRGAFVAMVRLGSDELVKEGAASRFDPRSSNIEHIIDAFRRRAAAIAGESTAAAVAETLKGLGDEWWAYRTDPLIYGWRARDPGNLPPSDVLLRVPEGGSVGHWPAPQSLREVEDLSRVRVLGLDD